MIVRVLVSVGQGERVAKLKLILPLRGDLMTNRHVGEQLMQRSILAWRFPSQGVYKANILKAN